MLSFGTAAPSLSSRLTSLGLVGGLHLLIVVGLAAGLMRERQAPPPAPPQLDILKDRPQPEPEPPKPLVREEAPPVPLLPVLMPKPEHWIEAPVTPTISAVVADTIPVIPLETPRTVASAQPQPAAPASATQSAGMLCPTQVRPQLPVLATEGSAQLRVVGTVRGGRVVNVAVQTLRALPERRAQRALLVEVERVLREGYACTQDGVFEQEFQFRVE